MGSNSYVELSPEQIESDPNIRLIRQRVNKDFSNLISQNSRILKVMYQVSNQLIYIITFETREKGELSYIATIDSQGKISV